MPHDLTGWIHTIAAIIALVTGSMILKRTKGNALHKRTGRTYAVSMLIVCATAFMIYRVHGSFGVLHIFALISTITLLLGMLPMYIRGYKHPMQAHFSWMYWSVIGLYSAFAAEVFTRLPMILDMEHSYGIFYALVGISVGTVGMLGGYFFRKKKKLWEERFGGTD